MNNSIDELLARMPEIAQAVNAFESPAVQELAFVALVESTTGSNVASEPDQTIVAGEEAPIERKHSVDRPASSKIVGSNTTGKKPTGTAKKQSFTLLKNLDLYTAQPTLAEFAESKSPSSMVEKCALLVYWFVHHGDFTPVTIDMVYTGFKDRDWPVPANLANTLQQAGTKGLLDSSDRLNLVLTTKGENLIDHELPR